MRIASFMLSELTISNFAIVERQSLSFHNGFNVISGETGAGKSIILNALEFILGGKLAATAIRTGSTQLEVQALFDLSSISESIRAELPEIAEGEELVVSRTLPREGRGKILINGRLATLSLLEEVVRKLVNICSQHHHTRLLDSKFHMDLLDGFAGLEAQGAAMKEAFREWQRATAALTAARAASGREVERRQELDELVAELTEGKVREGMRVDLEGEIRKLSSYERLVQLGQQALSAISGDEGAVASVRALGPLIHEMARLDPSFAVTASSLDVARTALDELERDVDRYMTTLDLNEDRLEQLRGELSHLARLERKYRMSDRELAAKLDESLHELSAFALSEDLSKLERDVAAKYEVVMRIAETLHRGRMKATKELSATVNRDLAEVNMGDARLSVQIERDSVCVTGFDRVQFLMSTNKGEPAKSLAEIASGGELSRVTLVLKKALRERSGVNVLIFDEVDTGVSGGVARSVGRMLKDLSRDSQVICITHLPQVASLSDKHFLVRKEVGKRTTTVVSELSEAEKVDEIARMLAGYKVTDTSRASARELIASNE